MNGAVLKQKERTQRPVPYYYAIIRVEDLDQSEINNTDFSGILFCNNTASQHTNITDF